MDDFLSKRLLVKKDKKKNTVDDDEKLIQENLYEFNPSDSKDYAAVENLTQQLKESNEKYRKLQKDYIKTKQALEQHALILSNFKNWVDMLDMMLNEGSDTVKILRDQVEELIQLQEETKEGKEENE